jgi:hypothetical protein
MSVSDGSWDKCENDNNDDSLGSEEYDYEYEYYEEVVREEEINVEAPPAVSKGGFSWADMVKRPPVQPVVEEPPTPTAEESTTVNQPIPSKPKAFKVVSITKPLPPQNNSQQAADDGGDNADEFYARKSHGGRTHVNSLKLRPDEAKRKDFLISKREAQRSGQR